MAPKKPQNATALLPPADDLAKLSPQKLQIVMDTINRQGDHKLRYALAGMVCGTACLTAALAASCYLTVEGHEKMAAVIVGTSVASLIGKIFLQRLP